MWVSQEECSVRDRVQTCSNINIYAEPSETIYSLKTHTCNFVFNTFRNGKPVQFFSSEKFEEKKSEHCQELHVQCNVVTFKLG